MMGNEWTSTGPQIVRFHIVVIFQSLLSQMDDVMTNECYLEVLWPTSSQRTRARSDIEMLRQFKMKTVERRADIFVFYAALYDNAYYANDMDPYQKVTVEFGFSACL
jgi:hypothetical protein